MGLSNLQVTNHAVSSHAYRAKESQHSSSLRGQYCLKPCSVAQSPEKKNIQKADRRKTRGGDNKLRSWQSEVGCLAAHAPSRPRPATAGGRGRGQARRPWTVARQQGPRPAPFCLPVCRRRAACSARTLRPPSGDGARAQTARSRRALRQSGSAPCCPRTIGQHAGCPPPWGCTSCPGRRWDAPARQRGAGVGRCQQ